MLRHAPGGFIMGNLSFNRLVFRDSLALYTSTEVVSGAAERSRLFYFVFLAGGVKAPETVTLTDCFDNADVTRGAFVFVDGQPPAPEALFAELKNALRVGDAGAYPRIAWRDDSVTYKNQIVLSVAGAVPVGNKLPFGRWIVSVGKGSSIRQGGGDQLTIKKSPDSGVNSLQVQVEIDDNPKQQGSSPDTINVPLSGEHTGGMLFDWQWQHRQLGDQFGGELRMFYGKDSASANTVRYPLFVPASDPGPRPKRDLAFKVTAHPQAPLNAYRTRLALAPDPPSGFNELASILMRTPTGSQVSLAAQATGNTVDGAGFGFAKSVGESGVDLYLTPVGNFSVEAATSKKPGVQVMAGISGSEFVLTEPGDLLTFENNRAAFAVGFEPGKREVPLASDFTTSWVKVHKNGAKVPADDKVVTTSYCAQPSSATYFGRHKDQPPELFPVAIGISLSQLATLPAEENPFFPFLPYGGIFYENSEEGIDNPNPNVKASDVGALERQAVEPSRRKLLQPTFDKKYGPIFFDAANNRAFEGGFARTPLGFVAELNQSGENGAPAGSWKTLQLAQSPQHPDRYLQLTANANGVVNPTFSNAVLSDNLFMVATDPELMWPSGNRDRDNEIQLGDFTFKVNVGPLDESTDADHPKALVIFKFMPDVSTVDLINQADRWTSFLGGGDVAGVQKQINGYIKAAEDGGDLFADFLGLVNDPNWTGMLVFNCPLDYQALPLDLQILLGGIDGTLRAHHFGVTINRVKDETTGAMSITKSSLFAVIDYRKDFVPPDTESPDSFPAFQVLLLNVEYANSKLVVFNSKIAFSIDTLFGNPAELTVAPDTDHKDTGTVVIDGVYTLHTDGTGSLVFSTDALRSFTFPVDDSELRVLKAQSVGNATLVPVERQSKGGGALTAISSFRLDGRLAFQDDIGGDLFSYGHVKDDVPDKGLVITNYAFGMTTDIPADGPATIEKPIRTDLSAIKVDATQSEARANSFEQTFPSSIDSLRYAEGGQDASQTGAWMVKGDGLDTAVHPVYMLRFKLPMGSLGGLVSSTNNITADFYLGWVSGAAKDAEDKVGAVLVLPAFIAGPDGFNLQGIASSSFEYVELDRQEFKPSRGGDPSSFAYDLLFVHFAMSLIGIPLFYVNGPKDLGMFGGPTDPGGSNAMWFVGKSEDTTRWDKGPKLSVTLDDLPSIFIGRAFRIETDPTDPNVIDEAIESLNLLKEHTVSEFMRLVYANTGKYADSAGITFALRFEFKSLNLSLLFHDNDFYGAQIKLDLSSDDDEDKDKDKDKDGEDKEGEGEKKKGTEVAKKEKDEDKKGLKKLDGFEFTIIYRKISEHLGVWSADIFVDVGQIELGAAQLTLPNFSISIWTNGDWRFAIGWPIDNHPITVQFQAGPIPVIAKAGFYLAKLRSADAPDQFGDSFNLIWSFGLGLSAGVGKEWEKGPFSASASLTLGLTVEGFLASKSGNITKDGVDYHWWAISLSLVGEVSGSVDFKIISASLSITLTLTLSLAIETKHSTVLTLVFEATVEASIKIIFITIHFSFSTTLTLLTTSFGSGPPASISGPNPSEVETASLPAMNMTSDMLAARSQGEPIELYSARQVEAAFDLRESFTAESVSVGRLENLDAPRVPITMGFMLQATSISADGSSWKPQGVASLLIENSGESSPFFLLSKGLAQWLLANFGGSGSFEQQLRNVESALKEGGFNNQVETCLQNQFTFTMSEMGSPTQETAFVVMPIHASLGFKYNGVTIPLGSPTVPANYGDIVTSYFDQSGKQNATATPTVGDSVASLLFDEYFVMYAKQLVTDLQKDDVVKTGSLDAAMKVVDLRNVGGFVSRFLMGGIRLPKPDNPQTLAPMFVLTNQQFALAQNGDKTWVLGAELVRMGGTPDWIVLDGTVAASLDPKQVYTSGPASAPPWTVGPVRPLSPVAATFPMNSSVTWTDAAARKQSLFNFSDGLHIAIEQWLKSTGSSDGPWLSLAQVTGSTQSQTSGKPYVASAALLLPLTLKTIPKPGGRPGEVLEDIYSLVGTDEVHRAYLQALLEDDAVTIRSMDMMVSQSRGNYASTKRPPNVLVRTNLSTSTAPGGGSAAAAQAIRDANRNEDTSSCANYAKPGEGGGEFAKFLRLVWECSIVHTGGFFLQVEGLTKDMFENGQASVQLLTQTGAASAIPAAEPYHNALVGPPPDDKYAVVATLASDPRGTSVVSYTNSYPGGSVGWFIEWQNAPTMLDAITDDDANFLRGLYQMVSYRVTAVDRVPILRNWSRPVTALSPKQGVPIWNYQSAFAAAPLLGDNQNTYAAVGKTIDVSISIEDIFGNTLPPSFLPVQSLPVVYNDDIMGLAMWAGVSNDFEVVASGGQVQLAVNFRFDTSVVQDSSGKVDPERLKRNLDNYSKIANQLSDPNMGAAVDTNSILAGQPLDKNAAGVAVVKELQNYVSQILSWLKNGGTGAGPALKTVSLPLDKGYPKKWTGDLREVQVSLALTRANVADSVAALAPQVRSVSSAITAMQGKSSKDDPTGLTTFALNLEEAYYKYDGSDDGVIKVATGINSDLKSRRLGMQSIWLMRWGAQSGVTVDILNDELNKPVFYAPPPLSTQLITRTVKGLRKYDATLGFTEVEQVFSSVDIDRWAADFLSAVENIFSPQIAPQVADRSSRKDEIYDPYVDNKTSLARSISATLAYIYVYQQMVGNPDSAKLTMYQALLNTLENDYGISTLVQMAAMISLHGDIEPGCSPGSPPNLYGNIRAVGSPAEGDDDKPLPYNLSPSRLPLKDGKAWLNFLLSVEDPAAQRALELDLDYQMGFVEHDIDPAAMRCDYTPSNWLTFVLQQNKTPLPTEQKNTLTAPMGDVRMPIPLRSFPPLPRLLAASAKQDTPGSKITTISQALSWTYALTVALPAASQDTLNLMVTFNEPAQGGSAGSRPQSMLAAITKRPPPSDLFDALARYAFEYPQLVPYIQALANGGSPQSTDALKNFSDLVTGVAGAWSAWIPPAPSFQPLANNDTTHEQWDYAIDHDPDGALSVSASGSRGSVVWPAIEGYGPPVVSGDKATYTNTSGKVPPRLNLSWSKLYVLDYQSARTSAYVERNRNLGGEHERTNEQFVYRTETVSLPAPVVPLIAAPNTLNLDSGSSLEATVTSMFQSMHAKPSGTITSGDSQDVLKLEGPISYSFRLLDNLDSSVRSFLPLFLLQKDIGPGEDPAAAKQAAQNMNIWRKETDPKIDNSAISFRLTIFATKIVQGEEQLPLVQFADLSIPVPDNNPGWW
jgi:hypothetical protein